MTKRADNNHPDPEKFKKLEGEIRQLISNKNFRTAQKRLRDLEREYGDSSPLFILYAEYFEARGQNDRAETALNEAIALDRSNKEAYMTMARLYDKLKQHKRVERILRQGIRDSGDPLYFYGVLEMFFTNIGNPEMVVEIAKEILAKYKDSGEVLYKKAEAAFKLELYPDAIDLFRQSLDKGYIGIHHYVYLANCFYRVTHYDEGLHCIKKALALHPDFEGYYQDLFYFLRQYHQTVDQKLLTAVKIKQSKFPGAPADSSSLMYLDVDEAEYLEYLEKYMEINLNDLSIDYSDFCEFYKNVRLNAGDFKGVILDPAKSLMFCINRLRELEHDIEATLYEGWYAGFNWEGERAQFLFGQVLQEDDLIEGSKILSSARQGMIQAVEGKFAAPAQDEQIDPLGLPAITNKSLAEYGTILSAISRKGGIRPKWGLEKVVQQMAEVIARSHTKSIVLSGPSGIGKTEAIRQLAVFLSSRECPAELKKFRIIQTSTAGILSGSKYLGIWEQRLESLCAKCSRDNRVIIYLEDIAHIFGTGRSEGSSRDFSDYLIPRMEQNEVVILGELDQGQAQRIFQENPRFEKVVHEIKLSEPDSDKVLDIIRREAESYNVEFTSESLAETVNLTETFMPYRAFPGKAVDLIKRANDLLGGDGEDGKAVIDTDGIVMAFCESTGIPDFIVDRTQKLEPEKLDRYFNERVLGQKEAIDSVKDAVTAFKAGLTNAQKPIKSFLFVGPTGVGKTELAKVLSEYIFGSPDRVIRLDMTEYSGPDATAKLLGYPGGRMTRTSDFIRKVRQNPFSVVLLDEIEKAHSNALNLLLQMLDEGIINDSEGKPAYFRTAIIIMTSNLGARHYTSQTIGFGQESVIKDISQSVMGEVRVFFSPEIYNRFDEVICFKPLTREVLGIIINREIGKVLERRGLVRLGVEVEIDPLVKEYILEIGYDPKYGARHIQRAVEKAVATPLATLIASSGVKNGDYVRVNMRNGKPVADIVSSDLRISDIGPMANQLGVEELDIPDKELAKTMESIFGRMDSLKTIFKYDEVVGERDDLQKLMLNPTFWDDPSRAREILKKFAELNRRTERIHKWEKTYERARSSLELLRKTGETRGKSGVRSQIMGLLKDLESAEMEVLLEGKHDFADAFLVIKSPGNGKEEVKWMLELAGVYTSWCRRRGYQYRIFGEQPKDNGGGSSVMLYIGGMNTFGLLKNERGIHRKTVAKRSGRRSLSQSYDCEILVLADVQRREDFQGRFDINIRKISPPKKGWKIKSLSRRVDLSDKQSDIGMSFFADESIGKDRDLPGDMFLSYMHYQSRKRSLLSSGDKGVWGSLVRTYEAGVQPRIIDHKTKIVIKSNKDYLRGKIDSILLERLL